MADTYGEYTSASNGFDRLESLKAQLEQVNKDKIRLEAAIKFLQENPGAEVLITNI